MLVTDLDGVKGQWRPRGKEVTQDKRPRSALHKKARKLLKERFPTLIIVEEPPIKVRHRKTLYFDFYIPLRKTAIEVHGQQHYRFNSLFHSSASDFLKQKQNDEDKAEWCEINGITLIVFKYDEDWSELL